MGTSARAESEAPALGQVAETLIGNSQKGVLLVKTKLAYDVNPASEEASQNTISVLVDKWFAENTFHADEFADLKYLLSLKEKQGVTISLALPALNEEETVGKVIRTVKNALMTRVPLLDEIVLIDSNSTDKTRKIAEKLGVPVHIHQKTLAKHGARKGKGEALWKSLYCTKGDIIIWIDTDIVNIHPRFIYGLIGPLLLQPKVDFVKGFYRRPLKVGDKMQAGSGGRVTELTARPLLNLFYPELSGMIQPLSGEYGGRRSALERLPFFSGYGVEIGLLIDMLDQFGLQSIAQVDLQERVHHNQPLEALGKMSFAIIQAVIHKLERKYGRNILENVNKTMKMIRYEQERFFLDIEEIAEKERPPMVEIPEYLSRNH
ncbi:MAG: glucosyl-3-phosphoglycerate synthase [Anaerolineales bacterium]|nr:glucosyl-3-phosphoglycerate synthase [Anaerolineales bacterium]